MDCIIWFQPPNKKFEEKCMIYQICFNQQSQNILEQGNQINLSFVRPAPNILKLNVFQRIHYTIIHPIC